jgi:cysteine desulfurase
MRHIYLDNNATTPVHPAVIEALLPFYRNNFGNPSCSHWAGRSVRQALHQAREQVAALVNCDPAEVVFTSGGSESLNMAIKGVVAARRAQGNHIITTRVEHSAVFNSCRYLEREGCRVTYLDVDSSGMLDLEALQAAINDTTILIAAMYANNETGTLFPVEQIGALAAGRGICCLSDSVQAVGKLPIDFSKSGLNFMTISGHKLYAPKGVGALIIKGGTHLRPLIHGGGQERNRRAGTENITGIVALGKACELAGATLASDAARIRGLRDRLEQGVRERITDVTTNGHPEQRLPNTLNLSFNGVYAEQLLDQLDRHGVAASAGSACSTGSRELSRVLAAMGMNDAMIRSSVRFSLGRETSVEEIDHVLEILPGLVGELRGRGKKSLPKSQI